MTGTTRRGRAAGIAARILLVAVPLSLFWVSAPVTAVVYDVPVSLAVMVSAVGAGSIALAAFAPRTGTVVHLASVAALGLLTAPSGVGPWPFPVTAIIGVSALLVVLGLRSTWRVTAAAWIASTLLAIALVAVWPARWEDGDTWGATFVVAAGNTLIVGAAAVLLGQRASIRDELASARRDVELEQARRRTVEERARIARELHDVVAHSMSVVHMQAESAPYRVSGLSPEARTEFAAIAATARTALGEMRQLLGTLRDGDAERAPQPQLSDLERLVASTVAAGIPTTLTVAAGVRDADRVAQLTAYRVVQEALGNVARHAPGAAAAVAVTVDGPAADTAWRRGATLRVEVANGAPTGPANAPPDDGGFGLRGMRERVEGLGGTLDAGPTDDGGYRLVATVPLSAPGVAA